MHKIIPLIYFLVVLNSLNAQEVILSENFNNGIPNNWTMYNDTNSVQENVSHLQQAWVVIKNPENELDFVVASTSNFSPQGIADRWLITPKISLGGFGNLMSWYEKSIDASFSNGYYVLISKTDSLKSSFTDTLIKVGEANPSWLKREVNLSEKELNNQEVFIAFVNNADDKFIILLDSIKVIKDNPLSISNIDKSNLKIYPNPFEQKINFSKKINNGKIIDINGRLISNFQGKELILQETIHSGMYFITGVLDNGLIFKSRIIKK